MIVKIKTFSGETLYIPEEDYLEEVMYSDLEEREFGKYADPEKARAFFKKVKVDKAKKKMSKTLGQITVAGRDNNGRYMDYLNKFRYDPEANGNLKHLEDMVINRKQMGDKWAHHGNPRWRDFQVLREVGREPTLTYSSPRAKLMRMREKNLKKIGETERSLKAKYKGASTEAGLKEYRENQPVLKVRDVLAGRTTRSTLPTTKYETRLTRLT